MSGFHYEEMKTEYLNRLAEDGTKHEIIGFAKPPGERARALVRVYETGNECPDCGGAGHIECVNDDSQVIGCERCGGTGIVRDGTKHVEGCPDCDGTGIIPDRDNFPIVYRKRAAEMKNAECTLPELIDEARYALCEHDSDAVMKSAVASWLDAIEAKFKAIEKDVESAVQMIEREAPSHPGAKYLRLSIIQRAYAGALTAEDRADIDDALTPNYTAKRAFEAAERAKEHNIYQEYDWLAIIACAADNELSIKQRKLIQDVFDYIPF